MHVYSQIDTEMVGMCSDIDIASYVSQYRGIEASFTDSLI